MEIAGYLASAFIGISLGLVGGGGSILTVPVLVYLFGLNPILATSYSLFIVGSTSLVGAYSNYQKKQVNVRAALLFGSSSMITVFITRKFIIPAIPETIFTLGGFVFTHNLLTMLLFAGLMLVASLSMILHRKNNSALPVEKARHNHPGILMLFGVGIGIITGLLGAGGGFMLIPALVVLLQMPMKTAVGTSLLIIALNSLIGFLGDLSHYTIRWPLLFTLTAIAIAGIFIGMAIGKKVRPQHLKKWFGIFVLIIGIAILVKEILFKNT